MMKQNTLFSILFGLMTLSIINIKTETPTEILNACSQDIITMNPDNINSVKNILKIVAQTITIGTEQFQKSINTVKHAKKEDAKKQGLMSKINYLLTLRYPSLIDGLPWYEVNFCNDVAYYKMKVFLLSQKNQDLFDPLSKHDQAIVLNIYDYIVTKIKQQNTSLQYLSLHGFFITKSSL